MRAIVTGGASGIGAAAAEVLRERGARVIVLDREVEPSDDAIRVDVTDAAGVSAAVEDAVARLGGLDVLVNNAGIGAQGTVEDNPDEEWHRVYDVNVRRDGPRHPRRPPPPARVLAGRDRQHLLGRRHRRPAEPRALQRVQGRRALPHARDGRRPRHRGHPRELRQPRAPPTRPGSAACSTPPTTPRPNEPPSRPANRSAASSAPARSRKRSPTSPAPPRPPPPAPSSASTEACRTSAYVNRLHLNGDCPPLGFTPRRSPIPLGRARFLKGTVPL